MDGLCEHQALIPDAICIGFDPQLADLGAEAFKAFRVTQEVLACRKMAEVVDASYAIMFQQSKRWFLYIVCVSCCSVLNKLKGKEVIVEVPLYVRNSLLIQAFLNDWICSVRQILFMWYI